MTSAAEALGLALPGSASIPAADSHHAQMATATGKRAVDLVWEDATPKNLLAQSSFDNAVTCVLACGGSTNAVIHLIAMARGAGVPLEQALVASGGLAVLRGNLAPDGAIVKPAAAEPRLLQHKGRAVVFEDYRDLQARLDDPALEVDADSVIVLRNTGCSSSSTTRR